MPKYPSSQARGSNTEEKNLRYYIRSRLKGKPIHIYKYNKKSGK